MQTQKVDFVRLLFYKSISWSFWLSCYWATFTRFSQIFHSAIKHPSLLKTFFAFPEVNPAIPNSIHHLFFLLSLNLFATSNEMF